MLIFFYKISGCDGCDKYPQVCPQPINNNSERPVDTLALILEKGESLADLLTTSNQEMLAHLKIYLVILLR